MSVTIQRWWGVIKGSCRDANNDLRRVYSGPKHWIVGLLTCTLIGGLVAAFTWLSRLYIGVFTREDACPFGEFSLYPNLESPWAASGFLQITMSFGRLSFGQAKAIDVFWDIVVGRGGQAALAYTSWRAFAYYVTTSMETAPITYSSFRAIFIETAPGIYSTFRLMRDFATRKGLHSRIAMVFIIFSAVFTLMFPTLASAMTGYAVNTVSQIRDHQGNSINFKNFSLLTYTVHDGDRVGLTRDFPITFTPSLDHDPVVSEQSLLWLRDRGYAKQYLQQYGSAPRNSRTQYGPIILNPPPLNISKHYDDGREIRDIRIDNLQDLESLHLTWIHENETYTQDYISKNGLCQSSKDYSWGFSLLFLYAVMGALLLWSIGISSMYMHSKRTVIENNRVSLSGEHKAIIHLFMAMQRELKLDIHATTSADEIHEPDLGKSVRELHGGSIAYSHPIFSKRTDLRTRIREIKWWLGAFVALLGITVTLPALMPLEYYDVLRFGYSRDHEVQAFGYLIRAYIWCANFGPLLGTFFACLLGTRTGSRVVITSVLTLLFYLAWIPVIIPDGKAECLRHRPSLACLVS